MKRIVFPMLLILMTLSGCSQKELAPITDIQEITDKTEAVLGFETKGMYNVPEDYMLELLDVKGELFTDFVMKIPTGTNQNEYGVFIAAIGHEKEAEDAVQAYLQSRKEEWDRQYLAEEGFKIDEGQCKREGRYIYFAIGSKDFDELNKLFKRLAWK